MKTHEEVIEKIEKIESLKKEIKITEKTIKNILDIRFFDPFFENTDIIAVSWIYYLPEHDYNDPRGFSHGDLEIMSVLNDSEKSELSNDSFFRGYENWRDVTERQEFELRKISDIFLKMSTDLLTYNFNYDEGRVVITKEKVMFFPKSY